MMAAASRPQSGYDPAPPYEFRGGNLAAIRDRSAEVLLYGPAGSGKTLAILRKLHVEASRWPRSRMMMIRKTRTSLTESAMETFENAVLGPGHPILKPKRQRRVRGVYVYPNGSEIVVGGIDNPDRVLSSHYDLIYVQEATELKQDDWETLIGRLRHYRVPYQQIIGDCNPVSPNHWLYRRAVAGTTRLIRATHQDNPQYYDATTQTWTEYGERYLERLERLTGPRRKRFYEGVWAAAEGLCFETWEESIHHVPGQLIPSGWTRFWAIDFGHTAPFVLQCWAMDDDGRIHMYREIYRTGWLVEDHIKSVLRVINAWSEQENRADWSRAIEPRPSAIVCDHDAEGRATIERYARITTTPAVKDISSGIQEVESRLRIAKDGQPRLFIYRNARIHRADDTLAAQGLPTCTAEEIGGYVWEKDRERPVKANDHGCDAMRYLCRYLSERKSGYGVR